MYFLSQDNDSHWYVVPVSRRTDWEKWLELDPDNESAWNTPDFAEEVGGSPSLVEFETYTIK